MSAKLQVEDALARLCNAECMLRLAIQAHDQVIVGNEQWLINESLRGVQRLLDGVYSTLGEAVTGDRAAESG